MIKVWQEAKWPAEILLNFLKMKDYISIKQYTGNFEGHEESWKEITFETPTNIVKQVATAVELFFKSYWSENMKVAPLHIAVEKGSLQLCQYVIAKTKDKNPNGN